MNDRADLAVLAAREGLAPWGVHLGQTDLPPSEARRLPGLEGVHLGASTHGPAEWDAPDAACDHAGVGPFRATATQPGHAAPIGLEGLRRGAAALRARGLAPVAIGGLRIEDAGPCFQAGAESLAMTAEVARSGDPGELLWQAQAERWAIRPPLARGQGVLVVGGCGAGKTTLAAELSRLLGLPEKDTDREIGGSIPEIFQERGEAAFRVLEAQAVARCLEGPCVAALGGGAWDDPATRTLVRQAGFAVLWLADRPWTPGTGWAAIRTVPWRRTGKPSCSAMPAGPPPGGRPPGLPLGRPIGEVARALVKNAT